MEPEELEAALRELDDLAEKEYHVPLSEVAARPGDDETMRLLRLGRLIGVLMKQPLAKSQEHATPSPYTGAYRSWDLGSEELINSPEVQRTWQYRALEALRTAEDAEEVFGWQPPSVYALAQDATERGFFSYLARSMRKYLCGDPELREVIEREVEAVRREGIDLRKVTPGMVVSSGGVALGAALIEHIPILGYMGAPAIGGIVFMFYSVGVDAFCEWASGYVPPTGSAER